jgi:predicted AAA+ superfamily ATPase
VSPPTKNLSRNKINWKQTPAAVWRQNKQLLKPVKEIDPVTLKQLIGIDRQKTALANNTLNFLAGKPANNALLWGSRGTGKSSLIKALLNEYRKDGLRLIEIFKTELHNLPDIVDDIRELPYCFIIYCDDFSFDINDDSYIALKTVLEGSIETPPDNVLIYATSNRRHLVPETRRDNNESQMVDGELHYADAIEEKISLSDRFGLWLSFYQPDQDTYLDMVNSYFRSDKKSLLYKDKAELHRQAARFATSRASRSGRTAKQFYQFFSAQVQVPSPKNIP